MGSTALAVQSCAPPAHPVKPLQCRSRQHDMQDRDASHPSAAQEGHLDAASPAPQVQPFHDEHLPAQAATWRPAPPSDRHVLGMEGNRETIC